MTETARGARKGRPFLLRTRRDGSRQASWRVWVLVWVVPVLFAVAAGGLAVEVLSTRAATVETTGKVARVYEWENDNPFDSSPFVYGVVVEYTWTDGQKTQASAGVSHGDWNFPIGTELPIRYYENVKTDIVIAGPTEWLVARVIALIALATAIPALVVTWLIRRWLARGRQGS